MNLPEAGPSASLARHNVAAISSSAATDASTIAVTVKAFEPPDPGSMAEIGIILMPSIEVSSAAGSMASAPGRLILSVFFCVTVEVSTFVSGRTESGMREVWRIGAVPDLAVGGVAGAATGAIGADKSDGRFSRMVLGAAASAGLIGIEVETPIAESSEMREVFDFAA